MPREKEPKAQHVSDFVETTVSTREKPAKERTLQDFLKEEQDAIVHKLDMLAAQKLIAEREKAIADLKAGATSTGESIVSPALEAKIKADMIASIMTALAAQGKDPEEVSEYLKALTPEVLAATATATQVNPMSAILVSSMLRERKPESITVQDVVNLVKTLQPQTPQQQTDIASLVTAIGNLVKGSQPGTTPITDFYTKTLQPIIERALEVKAQTTDSATLGPYTQIVAKVLDKIVEKGLSTETAQSIDMQKMELDFQKWKTEQEFAIRKLGIEKEADAAKWTGIIKDVIQPTLRKAGPMIDDAFTAGQQKLRTATGIQQPQLSPSGKPTFFCDNCHEPITLTPPFPDTITCPQCGTVYSKQGTPPAVPSLQAPMQPEVTDRHERRVISN